jgi:hypothetical protein
MEANMSDETNLLIAGFLKCGTTSLARYLADHPDISVPEVKELYRLVDPGGALAEYGRKIADTVPCPRRGSRKYLLDATPFYYSQRTAIEAAAAGQMKVIFLVRDPISRLKSSFRFFSEMYQEYPAGDFEQFVRALLYEGERGTYEAGIRSAFFSELFGKELEMGRYIYHINNWDTPKRNNILVKSLNEMNADPKTFMEGVCRFLKIDPDFYSSYSFKPFMRSYSVRNASMQKALRRYGGEDLMRYDSLAEYQSPLHFLGNGIVAKLADKLLQATQMTTKDYSLSKSTSDKLSEYYLASNTALKERYAISL